MDTRAKIVSTEEARRLAGDKPAVWVSGQFDPLLAEHARMLQAAAEPGRLLIVEVTGGPSPLLSARARAELVAGLAIVDYVVMSNSESPATDADIKERFIRHVRDRADGAKA